MKNFLLCSKNIICAFGCMQYDQYYLKKLQANASFTGTILG
ncbi:hypothetical protein [Mucilaginibacter arboris]|nr:hypothetical protein [Mucilaginibacter arboris]